MSVLRSIFVPSAFLALSFLWSVPASATLIFDLTCVLNGLNSTGACVAGPSFGTVTVEDSAFNEVTISVDLLSSDLKFKDLMVNLAPDTGITGITGDMSLSLDGFSIPPYTGTFDIGTFATDSIGVAVIQGVGGTLDSTDLFQTDSLGNVYVALHILSIGTAEGGSCSGNDDGSTGCLPGVNGSGSLFVGGLLPQAPGDDPVVPEPSTWAMLGGGLAALAWLRRKAATSRFARSESSQNRR